MATTFLNMVGRRFMIIGALICSCFFFVLLTAFRAKSEVNANLAYGVIIFIFIYSICFAAGMAPS